MPGAKHPRKSIPCLLYLPFLTGLPRTCIHNLEFLKVQFAFNGTYRNNSNEAKVGAILNWMGNSAFEVYNNFVHFVPSTSLNIALHLARNVTIVKRKITFLMCRSRQ